MADDSSNSSPPPSRPDRGLLADTTPRNPILWRLWIPVLAFLVGIGVIYVVNAQRRGRRLRAQLITEHALLTESLAPPYQRVRAQIERLTFASVGAYAGDTAAPGFNMARLTAQSVLYGRVRAREIQRVEQVGPSIRHRYPDQIATCLGLEVHWAHQFYIRGDFLMPAYVDSVRAVSDGDRLAALRQDLQFRLSRDTPDIVQWSRRSIFVLAVDEGTSSIDGATRLFVFDLENGRTLLRVRDEGGGTILVPFRIGAGGNPVARAAGPTLTVSQHDCSVANAVRQLLGVDVQTMRDPVGPANATATPPDAAPATAPANPPDAAPATAPATPTDAASAAPSAVDSGAAR